MDGSSAGMADGKVVIRMNNLKEIILEILGYAAKFIMAAIALAVVITSITVTIIGILTLCNTWEFNWWLPCGVISMALIFGIANVGEDWGWW